MIYKNDKRLAKIFNTFFTSNSFLRALASTCVGLCVLTSNRESHAVADATVGTDVSKSVSYTHLTLPTILRV